MREHLDQREGRGRQAPWGEVGQGALARMEEPIGRRSKGHGQEARWRWDPMGGWQRRLCCRESWYHHCSPALGVTWAGGVLLSGLLLSP